MGIEIAQGVLRRTIVNKDVHSNGHDWPSKIFGSFRPRQRTSRNATEDYRYLCNKVLTIYLFVISCPTSVCLCVSKLVVGGGRENQKDFHQRENRREIKGFLRRLKTTDWILACRKRCLLGGTRLTPYILETSLGWLARMSCYMPHEFVYAG